MMKRRAQAAMEFLMTYGWAVLVVLIVIGALAYFGVLNPQKLLPEKCTLLVGLYCLDHHATTNSLALSIENGMGRDIGISNIDVIETSASSLMVCTNNTEIVNISNGGQQVIGFDCGTPTVAKGSKYKFNVNISYRLSGSTFDHTGQGELFSNIE